MIRDCAPDGGNPAGHRRRPAGWTLPAVTSQRDEPRYLWLLSTSTDQREGSVGVTRPAGTLEPDIAVTAALCPLDRVASRDGRSASVSGPPVAVS